MQLSHYDASQHAPVFITAICAFIFCMSGFTAAQRLNKQHPPTRAQASACTCTRRIIHRTLPGSPPTPRFQFPAPFSAIRTTPPHSLPEMRNAQHRTTDNTISSAGLESWRKNFHACGYAHSESCRRNERRSAAPTFSARLPHTHLQQSHRSTATARNCRC